jgi:hypothetical protein
MFQLCMAHVNRRASVIPHHWFLPLISAVTHAGIEVKMITGDHLLIAKETMRMLSMGTEVSQLNIAWQQNRGQDQEECIADTGVKQMRMLLIGDEVSRCDLGKGTMNPRSNSHSTSSQ